MCISTREGLKSQGLLMLDSEVLVIIKHPLGTPPDGEYLKSPQPVPLRLRAGFDVKYLYELSVENTQVTMD